MQLLKDFFGVSSFFKDNSVIGLCGLRKSEEYVKITVPERYKKTYMYFPLSASECILY